MTTEKFSLKKRIKSFGFALNGLKTAVLDEHNLRIHLFAAFVATLLGFHFEINNTEWIILALTIGFVIAMELLNSAIESLADYACKEQKHPLIQKVKDIAAGAVLISAISALVVGLLIFIPKVV
jgi:diacylglycerol kinase